MIFIYLIFALRGYTKILPSKIADLALACILSSLALVSTFFAAYNVQTYFAIPLSIERRVMRDQIRTGDLGRARSIYVIGSTWRDSIAPTVRYEEFGLPFSAQPWSPGPAVYLTLRDLDPALSSMPIEVAPVGGVIKPPADALVVDMRKLRDFR